MYTLEDLKDIVARLRADDGCPWDRRQTHESMKKYLVEECGEVLEAIDNEDPINLCEELGDVLYQIMMHCEIEKEKGNFTIDQVIDGVSRKMIRRHPHVFGGPETKGKAGSQELWEEIKRQEKEEQEKERQKAKKP